jgi:hypothetical protein
LNAVENRRLSALGAAQAKAFQFVRQFTPLHPPVGATPALLLGLSLAFCLESNSHF